MLSIKGVGQGYLGWTGDYNSCGPRSAVIDFLHEPRSIDLVALLAFVPRRAQIFSIWYNDYIQPTRKGMTVTPLIELLKARGISPNERIDPVTQASINEWQPQMTDDIRMMILLGWVVVDPINRTFMTPSTKIAEIRSAGWID